MLGIPKNKQCVDSQWICLHIRTSVWIWYVSELRCRGFNMPHLAVLLDQTCFSENYFMLVLTFLSLTHRDLLGCGVIIFSQHLSGHPHFIRSSQHYSTAIHFYWTRRRCTHMTDRALLHVSHIKKTVHAFYFYTFFFLNDWLTSAVFVCGFIVFVQTISGLCVS